MSGFELLLAILAIPAAWLVRRVWRKRHRPMARYTKPVRDDRSSIQRFNDIIGKKV